MKTKLARRQRSPARPADRRLSDARIRTLVKRRIGLLRLLSDR